MPVKRRLPKRRVDDTVELDCCEMGFSFGTDHLCLLGRLGHRLDYRRDGKHSPAVRAVLKEAWPRLGRQFMATWKPVPGVRVLPYALERWGRPWEAKRNASAARHWRNDPF
jgi:hypothetical protein